MRMYIWRVHLDMSIVAFANSTKEARDKVKESWPNNENQQRTLARRPRIEKIPDTMLVNLFNYNVDGLRKTAP